MEEEEKQIDLEIQAKMQARTNITKKKVKTTEKAPGVAKRTNENISSYWFQENSDPIERKEGRKRVTMAEEYMEKPTISLKKWKEEVGAPASLSHCAKHFSARSRYFRMCQEYEDELADYDIIDDNSWKQLSPAIARDNPELFDKLQRMVKYIKYN